MHNRENVYVVSADLCSTRNMRCGDSRVPRRPPNKFQYAANDRSGEVFSSEWKSNVLRDLPVNDT